MPQPKPNKQRTKEFRLSTVHQAKGLEWKVIFILFVNEDMFPSKKTVEEQGDAEERRLFYVAITRAEDLLFNDAHSKKTERWRNNIS